MNTTMKNASQPSFSDICTLMRIGEMEKVQHLLQIVQLQPLEISYLQAWISCLDELWNDAALILAEIDIEGALIYVDRTLDFTARRKKPAVWWLLGNLAHSLNRPESTEHYGKALELLYQRRMMVPWLLVQVLCAQANIHIHNGHLRVAQLTAEAALQECWRLEESERESTQAHILANLCDLCGQQHERKEQARVYGEQVLALLEKNHHIEEQGGLRAIALYGLGNAAPEQEEAIAHYQKGLALTHDPAMACRFLARLARLALDAGNVEQARNYCEQTSQLAGVPTLNLGELAQIRGTIEVASSRWNDAIDWFLKALEIHPTPEVCLQLGEVLEHLVDNDQVPQTPRWHEAYHRMLKSY